MNSGTISNNLIGSVSYYLIPSGGVSIASGTFTMKGGTISGNEACGVDMLRAYGGGVGLHSGTFTLTGGTISGNLVWAEYNNETGGWGGGVYTAGTFTMSGGTISGNTAKAIKGSSVRDSFPYGGGVAAAKGAFTMTGGTISGNTTNEEWGTEDGGVLLIPGKRNGTGGGVWTDARSSGATFKKTGGLIEKNTSRVDRGKAVYATTASGSLRCEDDVPSTKNLDSTKTKAEGGGWDY
jgi:hypothetical protein